MACFCWGAAAKHTEVLGVALGQRHRQFVSIEPAMGCDSQAQHLTEIGWVGLHPVYPIEPRAARFTGKY